MTTLPVDTVSMSAKDLFKYPVTHQSWPITVAVLIGNSDDKLSQRDWAKYVVDVISVITLYGLKTHFTGSPVSTSIYQNYCEVFEILPEKLEYLKSALHRVKVTWKQDNIAILVGNTELI